MTDDPQPVTYREFMNFREDVQQDFARAHACDQRIEQKIDEIASKIDPLIVEFNRKKTAEERSFSTKQGVFLAFVGAVAGFVSSFFHSLFGGS